MIIALTGTNCSGKTTSLKYLESKSFECYSISEMIKENAKSKGFSDDRDSLIEFATKVREEKGDDHFLKEILKKAKSNKIAIESIRRIDEIKELKKIPSATIISIEAPIELRFKRSKERQRAKEEETTFEEFNRREILSDKKKSSQEVQECIKFADYNIVNDGNMKEFYKKIDAILKTLEKNHTLRSKT